MVVSLPIRKIELTFIIFNMYHRCYLIIICIPLRIQNEKLNHMVMNVCEDTRFNFPFINCCYLPIFLPHRFSFVCLLCLYLFICLFRANILEKIESAALLAALSRFMTYPHVCIYVCLSATLLDVGL